MGKVQNLDYILAGIFCKYKFSESERRDFLEIVGPIISYEEFKKRSDNCLYPHHDTVSLGEHILSDAALTYKTASESVDRYLAVIIAMFHDLYEIPWQNAGIVKHGFFNKHGFTHPIEASINAVTWYLEYFSFDKQSEIIIDGVIHHMWPFPARALNEKDAELNNKEKFGEIPINLRNMIIASTLRNKIGDVSFGRSIYPEGRLVSNADKIVSFSRDFTPSGAIACVTGVNKGLEKRLNNK